MQQEHQQNDQPRGIFGEKKMSPSNAFMPTPVAMSSTPPAKTNKKRSLVECLDDVRRLREHEQEIMHDILA